MGLEWCRKDSHTRWGIGPKLILAGRLNGNVDGRPVSLLFQGRDIILIVNKYRTLLPLRRNWEATVQLFDKFLGQADFRLLVQIGWLGRIEMFPSPALLVRLVLP